MSFALYGGSRASASLAPLTEETEEEVDDEEEEQPPRRHPPAPPRAPPAMSSSVFARSSARAPPPAPSASTSASASASSSASPASASSSYGSPSKRQPPPPPASSYTAKTPPAPVDTRRRPPPPPSAPPPPPPPADDAHAYSADQRTKARAITSFVSDPGMSSTLDKVTKKTFDTSAMVAPSRSMGDRRTDYTTASSAAARQKKVEKRRAAAKAVRVEQQKIQQLRGIFAAFDENRDGVLTKEELANALLSLGINPTHKIIQKYQIGSPTGHIDLSTFISVSMSRLQGAETTLDQILEIFGEFDPSDSGIVSSQIIRHLLGEVSSETALTSVEVEDLLYMTGIVSKDGPYMGLGVNVDFRELVNKMIFVAPSSASSAARLAP